MLGILTSYCSSLSLSSKLSKKTSGWGESKSLVFILCRSQSHAVTGLREVLENGFPGATAEKKLWWSVENEEKPVQLLIRRKASSANGALWKSFLPLVILLSIYLGMGIIALTVTFFNKNIEPWVGVRACWQGRIGRRPAANTAFWSLVSSSKSKWRQTTSIPCLPLMLSNTKICHVKVEVSWGWSRTPVFKSLKTILGQSQSGWWLHLTWLQQQQHELY